MISNIPELYNLFLKSAGVTTDSRNIAKGQIFFALKGDNFDGNEFALQALENGASYAVTDNGSLRGNDRIVVVENVLTTLQQLARHHREQFSIPIFALTGSNGKTTTKELISAVLASKYKVLQTSGNLNNHIGVPLTLLKITTDTEIAVIEMGASGPAEIDLLCSIAKPQAGLITNIGKAHLLGFGSLQGVIQAKGELYSYLHNTGGTILFNCDNRILVTMIAEREGVKSIPYGKSVNNAQINPPTPDKPYLSLTLNGNTPINTKLIGDYNTDNILAAIAVGQLYNVTEAECIRAIESYNPSNNRSQLLVKGAYTIIVDAYNANPTSMRAALDNFMKLKYNLRGVIIGDMLELGNDSLEEHKAIISYLSGLDIEYIFVVGKEFKKAAISMNLSNDKFVFTDNSSLMYNYLSENKPPENATFLIKGSRGIKLERTLEAFT